jgi:heme exporter protein CcmB
VRRQIGFLSHRSLLYDDLTAEQNLHFYAKMYGIVDADISTAQARIDDLLERVNLVTRRNDLVRTYSRGMLQRLAVARAVLHRPKLLLLDEPYTGLDPIAADNLTSLLTILSDEGCTLVVTTHNLESSVTTGHRAIVLLRGRIVADVPTVDAATFPAMYRELVKEAGSRKQEASGKHPASSFQLPVTSNQLPATQNPKPKIQNPFLRQTWAIVSKDIAAELHTREIFNAMFVFAALAMLIFSFALDLRGSVARAAAPGVLWSTIAFAGTLGLSRSMAREQQTGGIEGLLLAPVERSAIFFGKALGNLAMMLAVEVVLIPLATVMFDVPFFHGGVLLTVLLGTIGYAMVGTLLAAIAVNTRAREVMLPILLLPLMVPLLIAAVQTVSGLLDGATWAEVNSWTQLLVVYNLVITAISMVTFGYAVEE